MWMCNLISKLTFNSETLNSSFWRPLQCLSLRDPVSLRSSLPAVHTPLPAGAPFLARPLLLSRKMLWPRRLAWLEALAPSPALPCGATCTGLHLHWSLEPDSCSPWICCPFRLSVVPPNRASGLGVLNPRWSLSRWFSSSHLGIWVVLLSTTVFPRK